MKRKVKVQRTDLRWRDTPAKGGVVAPPKNNRAARRLKGKPTKDTQKVIEGLG